MTLVQPNSWTWSCTIQNSSFRHNRDISTFNIQSPSATFIRSFSPRYYSNTLYTEEKANLSWLCQNEMFYRSLLVLTNLTTTFDECVMHTLPCSRTTTGGLCQSNSTHGRVAEYSLAPAIYIVTANTSCVQLCKPYLNLFNTLLRTQGNTQQIQFGVLWQFDISLL